MREGNKVYAFFHLNMLYSSIEEEERLSVIENCYWPLLKLVDKTGISIGIELTGHTLNIISALCPEWVEEFKRLIVLGRCELIGSGYSQLIGPLVPYEVNVWNQKLGIEVYLNTLGVKPRLALVNEMAYSSGILDVYSEAGYQGIIMDRNNVCLSLDIDGPDDKSLPCYAKGCTATMPVLWSDSILFQKFQRYAHGDIGLQEYVDYFSERLDKSSMPLPVYSNDVEIFDFRPGRFKEEAKINTHGEWLRIEGLISSLNERFFCEWLLPSDVLEILCEGSKKEGRRLTSLKHPIPVKKQAKYNISRWAVSGHDDLWINTCCHRLYEELMVSEPGGESSDWKSLCELWASDYRTHLTNKRWAKASAQLEAMASKLSVQLSPDGEKLNNISSQADEESLTKQGYLVEYDSDGIVLTVKSDEVRMELNLRRGLTIKALAFASHDFIPVVGTLPQGYFHSIELGADFYSGGTVVEQVADHNRQTDLQWVTPSLVLEDGILIITAEVQLGEKVLIKKICINKGVVELSYSFPDWERPYGTVRAGIMTLLPDAFSGDVYLSTVNGGRAAETFLIDRDCNHAQPASTLVSSNAGLGGGSGSIVIYDNKLGLELSWDPGECAVFPMLHHQKCSPASLTRLIFSLLEVDETFREGGCLPDFVINVSPTKLDFHE